MRTRTNHFARGTRGWTRQSLESARRQANELTRPQGHLGPTPSELWAGHAAITAEQRGSSVPRSSAITSRSSPSEKTHSIRRTKTINPGAPSGRAQASLNWAC